MINFLTFYLEHIGGWIISPLRHIERDVIDNFIEILTAVGVFLLFIIAILLWIAMIPLMPILALPGMAVTLRELKKAKTSFLARIDAANNLIDIDCINLDLNETKKYHTHPYFQEFYREIDTAMERKKIMLLLMRDEKKTL